jgi:hypothetical protein
VYAYIYIYIYIYYVHVFYVEGDVKHFRLIGWFGQWTNSSEPVTNSSKNWRGSRTLLRLEENKNDSILLFASQIVTVQDTCTSLSFSSSAYLYHPSCGNCCTLSSKTVDYQ